MGIGQGTMDGVEMGMEEIKVVDLGKILHLEQLGLIGMQMEDQCAYLVKDGMRLLELEEDGERPKIQGEGVGIRRPRRGV